jgi:type VI protein secretion system component VasK
VSPQKDRIMAMFMSHDHESALDWHDADEIMKDFPCRYMQQFPPEGTVCLTYINTPYQDDVDADLKKYLIRLDKTYFGGRRKLFRRSLNTTFTREADLKAKWQLELEKAKKKAMKKECKKSDKSVSKLDKLKLMLIDVDAETDDFLAKHEKRTEIKQDELDERRNAEMEQLKLKYQHLQEKLDADSKGAKEKIKQKQQLKKDKIERAMEELNGSGSDSDVSSIRNAEIDEIDERYEELLDSIKDQRESLKNGETIYLEQ